MGVTCLLRMSITCQRLPTTRVSSLYVVYHGQYFVCDCHTPQHSATVARVSLPLSFRESRRVVGRLLIQRSQFQYTFNSKLAGGIWYLPTSLKWKIERFNRESYTERQGSPQCPPLEASGLYTEAPFREAFLSPPGDPRLAGRILCSGLSDGHTLLGIP